MEKAFLMIAVDEKDYDVLQFLWIDDMTKDEATPNWIVVSHPEYLVSWMRVGGFCHYDIMPLFFKVYSHMLIHLL